MKRNIAVKTWVKKPTDKALRKTTKITMLELIKEVEKCEFECQAGYLGGCKAWQDLKKEVNKL